MSYPWWRFKVTFQDEYEEEFTATGGTPTDAMRELLDEFSFEGDCLYEPMQVHGEIVRVEYLHCDTFGIDEESDHILTKEAEEQGQQMIDQDERVRQSMLGALAEGANIPLSQDDHEWLTKTGRYALSGRVCPRCGRKLTDENDPNFCEGCFQDYPL